MQNYTRVASCVKQKKDFGVPLFRLAEGSIKRWMDGEEFGFC